MKRCIDRGALRTVACITLSLSSACTAADSAPPPAFEVIDSAGVQIVHNHLSDAETPRIVLGEPILRLGSEEAGPELFGTISAVKFGPDNTVWIADASVQEIRAFALPLGEHRFTAGGKGDGPGEFRALSPIDFDEQGRLWVWDQGLGRLTVLDAADGREEVHPLAAKYELVPRVWARTPRGSFLAQLPQASGVVIAEGMSFRDTIRVWEIDESATPPKLWAKRRGARRYFTESAPYGQYEVPFSPSAPFAARGDRVAIVNDDGEPTFEVFENGRLVRRVTVDRERSPVTQADIDFWLRIRSEEEAEHLKSRLGLMDVPKSKPTWDALPYPMLSAAGHFLILRNGSLMSGTQVWDVFDPAGKQLGVLQLENGQLLEVGDRYLAVVERSSLGVGRVAVHPLPAVLLGASPP